MEFDTMFTRDTSGIVSEPGDPIVELYEPRYDADGVLYLEQVGTDDLYASIQSHKDSVDLQLILQRYNDGDISALSRVQGAYFDATGMPRTYAEMLNTLVAAEAEFNRLPVDVRAKFDHSFERFIASMDTGEFERIVSDLNQTLDNGGTVSASVIQGADAALAASIKEKDGE